MGLPELCYKTATKNCCQCYFKEKGKIFNIISFNFFLLTCKLIGTGPSSLRQLKNTGISPDDTEHVTCARPPSCRFFGKLNASITGGPVEQKRNSKIAISATKPITKSLIQFCKKKINFAQNKVFSFLTVVKLTVNN